MLYRYLASDADGKIVETEYEADDLQHVLQYLAGKNLRPISVKPLQEIGAGFRLLSGKISTTDKVFLTKYIALMLRVGTDLLSAIDILIADFEKPAVRNFLLEVRDNLSHGRPFHIAFESHPKTFSLTFTSLVKAAEASGTLQQTFEDLSKSLSAEAELRGRIRAALIYPILLLFVASGVVIFLATFALPKVAKVFTDTGLKPPLFSAIVFTIGLFIGDHIVFLLISSILILGFLVYFFGWNPMGHKMRGRIMARLPLIKKVYQEVALQRMATTMSSLLKAGLTITQAIDIAAESVGSEEYRASLRRVNEEGLKQGLTIGDAFRREIIFPKVLTNLIAISEKAGHLDEVLLTLADFYGADIDSTIKTLVSVIEPVLLIVMGLLVATIALSIIVPIYQLTAQF